MSGPPSARPPAPPSSAPAEPLRVWRDGACLVVRRGFAIHAPRCVLCGNRAQRSAAFAPRGTVSLQVPLCAHHASRHRRARFVGWGFGLGGLAAFLSGLVLDHVPLTLLGLYAALGGALYASVARQLLILDSSDRHFLRLRGADLRYLDGLRAWGTYPEPPA